MKASKESSQKPLHIETLAIHAGGLPQAGGDIMPALHLTTTYQRKADGSINDFIYSRTDNPNRLVLEQKIASLENSEEAIAFSSGMAAINALFENVLEPGSHVIIPDDCYHGTRQLLAAFFNRWKVSFSEVDMQDIKNIENAINDVTVLIWIESPSNPQLKITDIAAVAKLGKAKGIATACDNTFATSLLQKPLELGIDFVMHSSTKYLSGHSDIVGGILIFKTKTGISNRIRQYQQIAGAVPSPFDCWLLNRSLATFPLRVAAQCKNAFVIADFLSTHSSIEKVYYPGLQSHINHEIAARQMQDGFGSVVTVIIKGDRENVMQFAGRLQIFKHATSLGGVESLVEHRRSSEGAHPVSPDNLVRLSVGIEHIEDLLNDLSQALQ